MTDVNAMHDATPNLRGPVSSSMHKISRLEGVLHEKSAHKSSSRKIARATSRSPRWMPSTDASEETWGKDSISAWKEGPGKSKEWRKPPRPKTVRGIARHPKASEKAARRHHPKNHDLPVSLLRPEGKARMCFVPRRSDLKSRHRTQRETRWEADVDAFGEVDKPDLDNNGLVGEAEKSLHACSYIGRSDT